MGKSYDSKDIVVLEGLDAVRLRPGMYIGTTGIKGLHHILWEIVDNAIDEITNGFGNKITITLFKDGSAGVEDNGRGIPIDLHPILKKTGVEVVFTQLHAGGKFDNETYSYSGGLHGVGASVTNALSEWLKVYICRDKKRYIMEFASIVGEYGKIKSGIPITPLQEIGDTTKSGTKIVFMPDKKVFETINFNAETIIRRLKELAFLNRGIFIEFVDERSGQKQIFAYEGGLKDFVRYLDEGKSCLYNEPIFISGESKIIRLELSIQHTNTYTENTFSYVNNIPTTEGGTHETGLKSAITRVMNELARQQSWLKEKEQNLMGEDFREGITELLSIKMRNIQFEGQTKTKLGNPEAKTEVENIVYTELTKFFENKENLKIAEIIFNKAKGAAKTREAAKKAKELTRQKNSVDKYNLVGKLSACSSRKSELSELFIVEGDSAGGSAKQGRDREFQAILPLKGKPLNAEKKRLDQVLANEEIRTIISALETGVGEDFDIDNLRYKKVIILSDADQDGAHIRAILLTFFFRYMRNLINEGCVYIGLPPLYKVFKNNKIEYVYSDAELPAAVERIGKGYQIQRYKGLGEMNPEQLWETTMNPEKRSLIRVTIDDAAQAERMVCVLMGDDIESRKEYITKYANFNREDDFKEIITSLK
ncbi:MAG: DNA gyrase subunit B [Clostridia bacterium]|nr:DNA gyrase subunit B [Clostridia bacterium]